MVVIFHLGAIQTKLVSCDGHTYPLNVLCFTLNRTDHEMRELLHFHYTVPFHSSWKRQKQIKEHQGGGEVREGDKDPSK